jgi:hypothetical protein
LMRRLNSSWSRSIALVVRALFHWLTGNRVKVNSRVVIDGEPVGRPIGRGRNSGHEPGGECGDASSGAG